MNKKELKAIIEMAKKKCIDHRLYGSASEIRDIETNEFANCSDGDALEMTSITTKVTYIVNKIIDDENDLNDRIGDTYDVCENLKEIDHLHNSISDSKEAIEFLKEGVADKSRQMWKLIRAQLPNEARNANDLMYDGDTKKVMITGNKLRNNGQKRP